MRQTLQGDGVIVRFPRESNRLIHLPDDYSVLINQASSFTSVCLLLTLAVVILVSPATHWCLIPTCHLSPSGDSSFPFSVTDVLGQVEISLELRLCVWSAVLCSVLRATAVRQRWMGRMLVPALLTPSPAELALDFSLGIVSSMPPHPTQSYTPL